MKLHSRAGWLVAGAYLGLSACTNSGSGVDYPLVNIRLSSPSGISTNVLSNNGTFAYGREELAPPSLDPPGTTQELEFFPAFPADNPRQSVMAFSIDWASPLLDPNPSIDFVPIPSDQFMNVVGGFGFFYAFGAAPTQHIVRYWHGRCSASEDWAPIFDQVSATIFDSLNSSAPGKVHLVLDSFAPSFFGTADDIQHGFVFEAEYTAQLGGILQVLSVMFNPAYTLEADPSTGLALVTNTHQGIVGATFIPTTFKSDLTKALQMDLPQGLEQAFADKLTVSLANPVFNTACDANAAIADQQQTCFGELATFDGTPPSAPMAVIFSNGLSNTGVPTQVANALGVGMAMGLEPRNFLCQRNALGSSSGTCTFHPVIQRLNVLPNTVELVFAREVTDPLNDTAGNNQFLLYKYLPQAAQGLAPGSAPVPIVCDAPLTSVFGSATYTQHSGPPPGR